MQKEVIWPIEAASTRRANTVYQIERSTSESLFHMEGVVEAFDNENGESKRAGVASPALAQKGGSGKGGDVGSGRSEQELQRSHSYEERYTEGSNLLKATDKGQGKANKTESLQIKYWVSQHSCKLSSQFSGRNERQHVVELAGFSTCDGKTMRLQKI